MTESDAREALWRDIEVACRLNEADPVSAWSARFEELRGRAVILSGLRLDALRLRGPDTELIIGLPASARWEPPIHVNQRGIQHVWNLPSEEVYTVPDRDRVDGHVRLTRPANVDGRLIPDVVLTFSKGRVTDVSAPVDVLVMHEFLRRDQGTSRLGEIALVDRDSAVARARATFGVILLDENATSHIALGFGFPELVDPAERERVNQSGDHLDLMIGSDEIEITGMDGEGHERPLLVQGRWVL